MLRKRPAWRFRSSLVWLSCCSLVGWGAPPARYANWSVYHGGPEGLHYSSLKQINRETVKRLAVAWEFETGDSFPGSEIECNPVIADGVLYATTPKLRVIALDAATGKLRWSFDPNEGRKVTGKVRSRGVTLYGDRLFFVSRHFLYALDLRNGKPLAEFGEQGRVDLRYGLGRDPLAMGVSATSPGIVYKDLLILGSLVSEDLPSSPGDIRAFDVHSGKVRWTFHTIPHPGEFGYETWPKEAWKYSGGANNWTGMALDEKRGLVFAPTGSAAFDFYGANRVGDNLFANCLIALKAETGERVWHFQGVRHDTWDRDFPAPPVLVTVKRDGKPVDAVAQITKSGFVFLFERETGKPLFPIENREVASSEIDGEVLSKTQPFPVLPAPFARQRLTEDLLTTRTPEAHEAALKKFQTVRSAGQFTPASTEGTVIFPGFDGGGEWGGAGFDPESSLLYVNANEMAWILRLVPRPVSAKVSGQSLYAGNCASCHRADRTGTPPEFPSLLNLGDKYSESEVATVIRTGSGRMPAYAQLPNQARLAIARYVLTGKDSDAGAGAVNTIPGMKYTMDGYNKFLDPQGYPAIQPPWGTLNAIDLNSGELAWKVPFGSYPELKDPGTGSENYGGPVITAGGLVIIAATNFDHKLHIFDKADGKLLWEADLPAAGNATPATYEVNGRQFIVVACGGGKSGQPSGGKYVAFALR